MAQSSSMSHHFNRKGRPQLCKLIVKWLLITCLVLGIVVCLIDARHFTHFKVSLFGIPSNLVYSLVIVNHLALIGAVLFDRRHLLIVSLVFQCVLLVTVPVLIVSVLPSLLTYGLLLVSIVLSLVYSVLYIKNAFIHNTTIGNLHFNQDLNFSQRAASYNGNGCSTYQRKSCHEFSTEESSITSGNLVKVCGGCGHAGVNGSKRPQRPELSGISTVPRHSCQF